MVTRILVALAVLTWSAAVVSAQQKIEKGAIKRTPASDAKLMFDTYCAVCHGKDATGSGPAAVALTRKPADLTHISTRAGGKFPEIRVKRFIEGADEVAAHGTRDMPMWGDLFRSLDRDTAAIRVQALADFLKSLQKP